MKFKKYKTEVDIIMHKIIESNTVRSALSYYCYYYYFVKKETSRLDSTSLVGLSIFPDSCILSNLLKDSDHFFCCDVSRNGDLVQLCVHVIRFNICKATTGFKLIKETKEFVIVKK